MDEAFFEKLLEKILFRTLHTSRELLFKETRFTKDQAIENMTLWERKLKSPNTEAGVLNPDFCQMLEKKGE